MSEKKDAPSTSAMMAPPETATAPKSTEPDEPTEHSLMELITEDVPKIATFWGHTLSRIDAMAIMSVDEPISNI